MMQRGCSIIDKIAHKNIDVYINDNYRGEADPPPDNPQTDDDASGKLCDCGPGGRYVWANSAGQVLAPAPDDDYLDFLTPEGYLNFQALVPELIQLPGIATTTYGSSYLNLRLNLNGGATQIFNSTTLNSQIRPLGLYFNQSGLHPIKVSGTSIVGAKIYKQTGLFEYKTFSELKPNFSNFMAIKNIIRYILDKELNRPDIPIDVSYNNNNSKDSLAFTNKKGILLNGKKEKFDDNLDFVENMKSTLYHEVLHYDQFKTLGNKPYTFSDHLNVYEDQMTHSTFLNTTHSYQLKIITSYVSYLLGALESKKESIYIDAEDRLNKINKFFKENNIPFFISAEVLDGKFKPTAIIDKKTEKKHLLPSTQKDPH
jgi:hypothetical protein